MPEPITPTPVAPEQVPAPDPTNPASGAMPPADPAPNPEDALGDPGKRALAAERAARSRAEADLAALRKEIEDANKTAEQKAADDLRAAQALAAENATKALRYEVAAETGIPLALATRLAGANREELLADAETLKSLIPAGATPPAAPRIPAPDPGQGPRPGGLSEEDEIYASIFGPNA